MSEEATISKVWESIPVGDDLGTLDYARTAQMGLADYRRVVDNPLAGVSLFRRPPSGEPFSTAK